MSNKMIYIRKGDESFWHRLDAISKERGVSQSVILSELVRGYVYSQTSPEMPDGDPAELTRQAHELLGRALELQRRES